MSSNSTTSRCPKRARTHARRYPVQAAPYEADALTLGDIAVPSVSKIHSTLDRMARRNKNYKLIHFQSGLEAAEEQQRVWWNIQGSMRPVHLKEVGMFTGALKTVKKNATTTTAAEEEESEESGGDGVEKKAECARCCTQDQCRFNKKKWLCRKCYRKEDEARLEQEEREDGGDYNNEKPPPDETPQPKEEEPPFKDENEERDRKKYVPHYYPCEQMAYYKQRYARRTEHVECERCHNYSFVHPNPTLMLYDEKRRAYLCRACVKIVNLSAEERLLPCPTWLLAYPHRIPYRRRPVPVLSTRWSASDLAAVEEAPPTPPTAK